MPQRTDVSILPVSICFVLSGFAALIYETVWLRQFSIVFGTSEFAVAVVLAGYMAGLAIGGALAPQILKRVRSPVRTYAIFELGIALAAIVWVPGGMWLARVLKVAIFGNQAEPQDAGALSGILFDQITSFGIIMVPTILMGATLPLLARHVVTKDEHLGRRIGLLYSSNTLGAVAGTLVGAFWLLPTLGLRATNWVGAAVNVLVFGLAAWTLRDPPAEAESNVSVPDTTQVTAGSGRWVLPLILISGATSFAYEILWTRMLGHVMGASVFAFATMLSAFLMGITLGSALASRFSLTRAQAAAGFVYAQLGTAACSLLVYHGMEFLPQIGRTLNAGEHASFSSNVPLAILVLLPSTTFLGATFPFAVRILARRENEAASAAGTVYAWNTIGAIAGAMLTGMVLLPRLNYEGTAAVAVATNLLLATFALAATPKRGWKAVLLTLLLLVTAWQFRPQRPDAILRASPFARLGDSGRITHYQAGRSSTVVMLDARGVQGIRTNGLPEAGIPMRGTPPRFDNTESWLCSLPVLLRPELKSMLVVGFGGGNAVSYVPPSVDQVDVFEIEPEVIQANRIASATRYQDPLLDPRIRVILNDARNGLGLTSRQYDAIVSQPSHPWTAGASHLYTREFAQLAHDHLQPGGVFVQWMSDEFIDDDLFRSLGATLLQVFDHVRVYRPKGPGMLFVGSDRSLNVESQFDQHNETFVANAEFFGKLGVSNVEDLCFLLALDSAALSEICGDSIPITDDDNRIALRTRETLQPGQHAVPKDLFRSVDPVVEPLRRARLLGDRTINYVYLTRRLFNAGFEDRAKRLAVGIPSEMERRQAEVWLAIASGDDVSVATQLGAAGGLDLDNAEACFHRFLLGQLQLGDQVESFVLGNGKNVPVSLKAVIQGTKHAQAGQWDKLAILESDLATVGQTDGWFAVANQLRITWRMAVATRENRQPGIDAIDIIDQTIPLQWSIDLPVLRAQAAIRIGDYETAVGTISDLNARIVEFYRSAEKNETMDTPQFASFVQRANRLGIRQVLQSVRNAPGFRDERLDRLLWELDLSLSQYFR